MQHPDPFASQVGSYLVLVGIALLPVLFCDLARPLSRVQQQVLLFTASAAAFLGMMAYQWTPLAMFSCAALALALHLEFMRMRAEGNVRVGSSRFAGMLRVNDAAARQRAAPPAATMDERTMRHLQRLRAAGRIPDHGEGNILTVDSPEETVVFERVADVLRNAGFRFRTVNLDEPAERIFSMGFYLDDTGLSDAERRAAAARLHAAVAAATGKPMQSVMDVRSLAERAPS